MTEMEMNFLSISPYFLNFQRRTIIGKSIHNHYADVCPMGYDTSLTAGYDTSLTAVYLSSADIHALFTNNKWILSRLSPFIGMVSI